MADFTIKRLNHLVLWVRDAQRSLDFYRDILGMQSPDWDAKWPEIETGNVSLYLVDPTVMGNEFVPHTAPIALRVPSVPETKSELEARGLQFTGENDSGVCKMAFFEDSEGNSLMLHRRYAP